MTISPAPLRRFPRSFGDGKLLPGVRGGNLARVISNALSTRTGHFLFVSKQLKKLLRQVTNAGGVSSFPSHSAGAASRRRCNAKSRPHVIQIDHVAHIILLPSFTVLGGHSELRERCS